MKPIYSIIVPSYNSLHTIGQCLTSLCNQEITLACEIIVADSSNDGTPEFIKQHFPGITLICLNKKTPPGAARNAGANHANGLYLLFTDADCIVSPNWIEKIHQAFESGKEIVGGGVTNARPESFISRAEYFIEFREFSVNSKARNVSFLPSCNFAIKKSVFDQLGGFPNIRASEDVTFSYQLRLQRKIINFDPAIAVAHLNRNSLKPFLKNQFILGKYSAIVRKSLPLPGKFFIKTPYLFWILPFVRTIRTIQFITTKSQSNRSKQLFEFLLVSPIFLGGATWWSIGFFRGAIGTETLEIEDT